MSEPHLKISVLDGPSARPFLQELAQLRIRVFFDFPYLYEGSLAYETQYLETYFKAPSARLILAQDHQKVVGASTVIHLPDEVAEIKDPLVTAGFAAEQIAYFGESVLMPEYRGRGLGKAFFVERLAHARSLVGVTHAAFCAVVRPSDHPLRPSDYRPLDGLWQKFGFAPKPGLQCSLKWQDRGEASETYKNLQFWLADLASAANF